MKESSTGEHVVNGPYEHHLDLTVLNNKLNQLDKREMHAKRQDLEKIYWVKNWTYGVMVRTTKTYWKHRKLP